MIKKTFHNKTGFTLIETFVAITILVLAILGPLAMFARVIMNANYAKNQVIAFYLAQEGLELVNNIKDNNIKKDIKWLEGLDGCKGSAGCNINPSDLEVLDGCNTSAPLGCPIVKQNNLYLPASVGVSTVFRRAIKISNVVPGIDDSDQEAEVEATVVWNNRGKWQKTVITSHIFNY